MQEVADRTEATENGVEMAIKAVGTRRQLAEKIGVTYEAVRLWTVTGVVPTNRVLDVERATGVRRELLNPKTYPKD